METGELKYLKTLMFTLCVIILGTLNVSSQGFEARSYVGVSYYQGDLSPLPTILSFSRGHLTAGVSTGYHVSKNFSIHTKFLRGTLSGTDADASTIGRRERNLSFNTSFTEYGFITEFSLNSIFKKLNKYGVNFYYTTGINIFKFNPRAQYNGQWVDLQPLGTEGQNIPGVGAVKPYSLSQVNIPFGIGAKFKLNPLYSVGIEIAPRLTFTDYIDDVSTNYVSFDELLANGGPLSAALSNRTGEYFNSGPLMVETGTLRGDSSDNDWYLNTSIYFSYRLGSALPVVPSTPLPLPAPVGVK